MEYARGPCPYSTHVTLATWALYSVLFLLKTSKEVDCKTVYFLSSVDDAIILPILHSDLLLSAVFKQRGLFSKLVGSLRRTRRPNTGREDIELGNLETRRNRAYTSDARLNMAR